MTTAFAPTLDQKKAIERLTGEVCITAGAGSGKTRTLAERVAAALGAPDAEGAPREALADVRQVLAVTFTEKAAGEIAERVRRVLIAHGLVPEARRVDEAWISTIHGLCTRILRANALAAGLDPDFVVATEVKAGLLREEAFEVAAAEAMRAGGDPGRLIDGFGLGRVSQAVTALHGKLRAMGRTPGEAQTEEAPAAREILAEAVAAHRRAIATLQEDPDPKKTMTANLEAAREALAAVEALAQLELDDDELLNELLRIERGFRPSAAVGAAAKPLVQEVKDRKVQLLGRILAAITGAYAAALLRLAEDFEAKYEALKSERGLLDFEDLQLATVRLLESDPSVARRYREAFRLVMVDEFQDTNEVQIRLADALRDGNLCTVGDDKQSIYGFRYADVEAYRAHRDGMIAAGAEPVEFRENFRSHPDVLHLVNQVFSAEGVFGSELLRLRHGRREEDAPAWPPGQPRLRSVFVAGKDSATGKGVPADSVRRAEADAVAAALADMRQAGVRQGDMVMLLRGMTHVEDYVSALEAHGLDAVISAGGTFLSRPEVLAARSLLRAIVNSCDAEGVLGMLASGLVGVSDDGLMRLAEAADRGEVLAGAPRAGLSDPDASLVARAATAVARARAALGRRSLGEIVLQACEDLDYDLYLLARGRDGRREYANVLKLVRLADEYERTDGGGPGGFLDHLALKERFAEREAPAALVGEEDDAVRVMTIHAAKGLEFPVVAIPGLGKGLPGDTDCFAIEREGDELLVALSLPDDKSGASLEERSTPVFRRVREMARDRETKEEQRLFYVACTRAREALVLAGVTDVDGPAGDSKQNEKTAADWLRRGLGLADGGVRGLESVALAAGAVVTVSVIEPWPTTQTAPAEQGVTVEAAIPAPQVTQKSPALASVSPPATVSHSDLALFATCPLRYHFERRARLGTLPSTETTARDLGDAVHAALAVVDEEGAPPSAERLRAIAARWRLEPSAEKRMRDAVNAFCRSEAHGLAYGEDTVPLHEVPFAVPLASSLLVGKIDLLVRSGRHALVVDYKTGYTAEEALDPAHFEGQARVYALAALAGGADEVESRFVALERLGGGRPQEAVFRYGPSDRLAIQSEVETRVEGMAASPLSPLPAYDARACTGCAAAGEICRVGLPGRVSGKTPRTPA
jgi:ATP-dependent exoDNAse (exonuclease V) beta subunit